MHRTYERSRHASRAACGRGSRKSGFTLIECMTVLSIASILLAIATPSFARLIRSNAVASDVNSFLADVRYTRSEALRRGGNVVLCRSDAPEDAQPVCGTGAGTQSKGWATGWVVFHDLNANGSLDANEPVLRRQAGARIDAIDDSGPSTKFRFTATGRLLARGTSTTLRFGSPGYGDDLRRTICVGPSGRPRVAGDGAANCSGDA